MPPGTKKMRGATVTPGSFLLLKRMRYPEGSRMQSQISSVLCGLHPRVLLYRNKPFVLLRSHTPANPIWAVQWESSDWSLLHT